MSMFKSLQSIGGVITLFHNPASKASEALLKSLESNIASSSSSSSSSSSKDTSASNGNSGEFKYTIDVTTNLPTPEQFNFFKDALHMHPFCKKALKTAFPNITNGKDLVKDLQNIDSEVLRNIDIKSAEANKLFVPPLVVDWDHKLLAVSEKGLEKILDQYNGASHKD